MKLKGLTEYFEQKEHALHTYGRLQCLQWTPDHHFFFITKETWCTGGGEDGCAKQATGGNGEGQPGRAGEREREVRGRSLHVPVHALLCFLELSLRISEGRWQR